MTAITASSIDPFPRGAHVRRALLVRASAWLAVAIVLVVYLWIASAGTWTRWPTYGKYYQDLADGFRKGQLALATKPDPRLLALKDPFDPVANEGLRIHDVSLYNGKFYIYWGPVPAGFLAAANTVGVPKVADQYLAFLFAAGALVFASRLILHLWRHHFRETVPAWAVPLAILTVGLANPGPFNLARASVYEASILAAQMFLVAGIHFVVTAFRDGGALKSRLILAGMMLAMAVGSRASVALPVIGVSMLTAWQVIRLGRRKHEPPKTREEAALRRIAPPPADPANPPRVGEDVGFAFVMPRGGGGGGWHDHARPKRVRLLLAFLTPLVIGAGLLGWYNHARFGSVTELGIRYQLAGFNSTAGYASLASPRNVAPNVYSYLFRPPLAQHVFPYLIPRSGLDAAFPRWVPVPAFHVREETATGMLLAAPFVAFAAVAITRRRRERGLRDDVTDDDFEGGLSARRIALILAIAVLLAVVPALILSFATMRYLADWTMPLLLMATIGFWTGIDARAARPWSRCLWLGGGAALMGVTVLVGPLLGVTGALDQFARHNPALMKRMIEVTYRGPVPGIAQVSGPAGVDETDDGRGWWVGRQFVAVDVIAPKDGAYTLDVDARPAAGLFDHRKIELDLAADPEQPLPKRGKLVGLHFVPGRPAAPQPVTFDVSLRKGLNRLFFRTPDVPEAAVTTSFDERRLIEIAKIVIREQPAGVSPSSASLSPQ